VPAKDKQNLYLCEWTLKSNDKSLVRRQKQTVAEQFVVKCKLKAVDDKDIDYDDDDEEDEADDAGDGDGDGDGGSWYDFGANEKEKVSETTEHWCLALNGLEISQMYGLVSIRH